jgi:HAD superfamily hydrolase (TIGR01509 family)
MTYKYFLFDWDGSLADTLPIWFEGFKKVFAKHGVTVTNEIIADEVLGDWEAPGRLGVKNSEKFFADLEAEVIEKLNQVKLNEGALELLTKIKAAGGKIAVVTASKKRWVKTALRENGLRDLVDVFLGKEDVTYVKPDPEALFKALELMNGKAEESIMVGDSGKDVMAGRRVPMNTAIYFPERYSEFYSKETQINFGAKYMIGSFKDLEKFL